MRVTAAELVRDWAGIADKALTEPVTIVQDGRGPLVVLSAAEYARLKRRDRRAVRVEELTEEEIELIAQAEPPPGTAHLDALLDGKA